MAHKGIPKEAYDRMVEAYREKPNNHNHAAIAGGVDRSTARKAWRRGWPQRGWAAIEYLLKTERMEARAALQEKREAERAAEEQAELDAEARIAEENERQRNVAEKARADAVDARQQEGQMIRVQRGNIIALMGLVGNNLRIALEHSKTVKQILDTGKDLNGRPITLDQRLRAQRDLARLLETASNSMRTVIETERLIMGEPTEIIGLNVRDMTLDDAAHVIDVSDRALARARKKGLVCLPGGKLDEPLEPADEAVAGAIAEE